ncbi:HAD-IIIA family hydrolase [Paenibacillus ginsengarvi]|uniref:HAD-IIIA family hydrolase n=1 Tax=Paenibacillus ginsengarvi TaxID=400777 RepID=A0A3B0CER3_9BACL|nr:HAD-IIIA family hydrolase [Paenibacillus ginsengarvi]RKN82187.1 HAD-IIIA family hydrolase [Paenibacillus ginsengarvi]
MQAVIMAGGKGTRLRSITNDQIPKPMACINGKTILEWQIECLKSNNITNILIVTGHLGRKIEDFFKDGAEFGVKISYFREEQPLGSAGALYYIKEKLISDTFLLVYGDVLFDIDIQRMIRFHREKNSLATLFTHPNSHPYDSDLVVTDEECKVIKFDSKNNNRDYWYKNCVNAGLFIANVDLCNLVVKDEVTDLEKDIFIPLTAKHAPIYSYFSPEYIKDVGTPERIAVAAKELASGFVSNRNLKNKQKCIFLDRDGTINRLNGLISSEDDLSLEPCATEAIRKINQSGYLAIVVTNQPVVARGLCNISDVENIHKKLESLLGKQGVILDDILFCPHHPDKGYPEENPIYKIPCQCRKPNTGMIEICIEKYNIDVKSSWIVGDTTTDILTGQRIGLQTALVLTGEAGADKKYDVISDITCNNLLDAINNILLY